MSTPASRPPLVTEHDEPPVPGGPARQPAQGGPDGPSRALENPAPENLDVMGQAAQTLAPAVGPWADAR